MDIILLHIPHHKADPNHASRNDNAGFGKLLNGLKGLSLFMYNMDVLPNNTNIIDISNKDFRILELDNISVVLNNENTLTILSESNPPIKVELNTQNNIDSKGFTKTVSGIILANPGFKIQMDKCIDLYIDNPIQIRHMCEEDYELTINIDHSWPIVNVSINTDRDLKTRLEKIEYLQYIHNNLSLDIPFLQSVYNYNTPILIAVLAFHAACFILQIKNNTLNSEMLLKWELENLPLLDSCWTQCDADQEKEEKKEDDGFGTILLYSDYEEEKEEDSESENTQDNVFELFKKFLGLQGQCIEEDIKDDVSCVMCKRSFGMNCDSHNNQSHPGNGKKLNRPELDKKLIEFGFSKPGLVTTNGNCLFETLAYLIHYNDINNENRHTKLEYYAPQIRNNICEHLHKLLNDNECLSAILNNEYINTMNTDTVYGTAIEVQAAAELYGYHLTIITDRVARCGLFKWDYNQNTEKQLYLLYLNNNHYQPIRKDTSQDRTF